jgi:hypothetical protein
MGTPPMPSLGSGGGGMPDIGSGLSGFGQQLSDVLGSLFGSAEDALPDSEELEKPDLREEEPEGEPDDELEEDELDENAKDADEAVDPATDTEGACETPPVEPPPVEPLPPPVEPPPVVPPEPVATPAPLPPAEPLPPPEPMATNETPCEIAADELPQVGP